MRHGHPINVCSSSWCNSRYSNPNVNALQTSRRAYEIAVFGVEASPTAHLARRLVLLNGMDDVVSIVHGRAEEVMLPISEHSAHIVVSEWMGYALICVWQRIPLTCMRADSPQGRHV